MQRIMIAAASSGSGKTTVVCGLLELFRKKNISVAAFKCGPDFIDPLFHRSVNGTDCGNLDTFFTEDAVTREILARESEGKRIALIEGVMGYYDGIGFEKDARGSSAYLAAVTGTPVILVVNAKGMSRSAVAMIRGFLEEQTPCMIRGILLNRISSMVYPAMKQMLEEALPVRVVGYLPEQSDFRLESRHLGLVKPDEIPGLRDSLEKLAGRMETTIDLDDILEIASEAEHSGLYENIKGEETGPVPESCKLRIGIAKDEAFCFIYRENLDVLRKKGCDLCFFSPIRDRKLPEGLDGLILSGGYPELYAEALSRNEKMRQDICGALKEGLPAIAECGGFLYLHRSLTDLSGHAWPMAGFFDFSAKYAGKLGRFGYIDLKEGTFFGEYPGSIRAHEFHYYESDDPGEDFLAVKPSGTRSWRCVHSSETLYAGFPHLYYPANPEIADAFLKACRKWNREKR